MSCCLPAHVVALGDHVAWRALVYLAKGNTSSVKFFERHISPVSTHFRDQSRAWPRIVPHIVLVIAVLGSTGSVKFTSHTLPIHTRLAKGNTGSVKFTFTHALVKGLRRCPSYLL